MIGRCPSTQESSKAWPWHDYKLEILRHCKKSVPCTHADRVLTKEEDFIPIIGVFNDSYVP